MKCFFPFKAKSKDKQKSSNSAPELRNQSRSSDSALHRAPRSLPSPRTISQLYIEKEHNLRVFTYQELKDATKGFSRMLKIGEGGFGSVYKGTIGGFKDHRNPIAVAIKKLNKQGFQGDKQWLAEIQFLGVVNHPNVVKLIGYCSDNDERGIQRLLVYEFMANRSMEDHLFNQNSPTLPWRTRLDIMHGAAQGLSYLHSQLEIKVIYRDFKSSNVLLDENLWPKLSDFGLAREGPTGDLTHVSTAKVGTYGYAAPEYVETGHLRTQSDVWSFGVVLYEIITGRRAIERSRPPAEQKLLEWVAQFPPASKRFSMIVDPRLLRNGLSIGSAKTVAKLADKCLSKDPKERPAMADVVETLRRVIEELELGDGFVLKGGGKPEGKGKGQYSKSR